MRRTLYPLKIKNAQPPGQIYLLLRVIQLCFIQTYLCVLFFLTPVVLPQAAVGNKGHWTTYCEMGYYEWTLQLEKNGTQSLTLKVFVVVITVFPV